MEDMEGKICGILAGGNLGQREGQTSLLKNMKFSFGMLCHNLQSYERIREQRDRDALTGLYNRTRYERELPVIFSKYKNALACIYIDVDGLHEMNNREGHGKGDLMLKDVRRGSRRPIQLNISTASEEMNLWDSSQVWTRRSCSP